MEPVNNPHFHHAIRFREDICIGCSHCMNICPTEAVRVAHGKAHMHPNRCVDCGECYRVCPVGAITVEQDDFDNIFKYNCRVALVPAVFTGQFPDSVSPGTVLSALKELGFTHVYEVEEGAEFLSEQYNTYLENNPDPSPMISSFCPAVVRLIQVKFPTLTRNIVLLKAPIDITAVRARQQLLSEGFEAGETGIFYITPCPAKIVAVKNPVGTENSGIDGVISMNFIYNKVYKVLRNKKEGNRLPVPETLSESAICWSLTGGEASQMKHGRSLAIDEINNVIEFLEKVENEEVDGIRFLELRACDESCAGGILCVGNRFLTTDKLRKRGKRSSVAASGPVEPGMLAHLKENMNLRPLAPRSILKLDDDVSEAMKKMKRIYDLNRLLPQVDCGICGSPTCKSLSEDIIRNEASLKQCIFIQKIMEQNEQLEPDESVRIMRDIWSENKLDRNILKDGMVEIN